MVVRRLLDGPDPAAGWERLDDHVRRLRACPDGGSWLLDLLERSGLRGRGGASFPTWRKWTAVAERSHGQAVVVMNAAEGEPLSAKDRLLLTLRPHLVLDGAALAAATLGAGEIVLYLSRGSRATHHVVRRAVRERRRAHFAGPPVRIVRTAHRYVAGEASAAVRRISGGPSKPQFSPPRAFERGVGNRPTLVQNVETLAHVALIARYGSGWFREVGTDTSPGTALMTLSGNIRRPGVYEVDLAARSGSVLAAAGGTASPPGGALLGGYFGTWLPAASLWDLPLDSERLRRDHGASLGCGVLAVLPQEGCGIAEAARILSWLAAESAGQCGPCVNGLAALATTVARIARSDAVPTDLEHVRRWAGLVSGRGACHHPDGAVGQLASALMVFSDHLDRHLGGVPCPGQLVHGFPAPPPSARGWR
ncbi:MAG: NADH-ubiquinone oxidoreductase-F iron-sulfur binding region domain-containing protein [Candidatus Dormibacteria bacterium]